MLGTGGGIATGGGEKKRIAPRRPALLLSLSVLLALIGAGSTVDVSAQTVETQTVQAQQSPPTTLGFLEGLVNALLPSTTLPPATPAPSPPEAAGGSTQPAAAAAPVVQPSGDGDRVVPPGAQAVINSVRRTGSSDTLGLLGALAPLVSGGLTLEEAAIVGMGRFPVAGEAYYSDDWLAARFTPTFHHHMGTDIFAARGTPVRAPTDGVVSFAGESAGGLSAYLTTGDGTYYYMAHLDGFARGVRSGQKVTQGTVVAFVGSTGNAEGGSPHVHFEVHPRGGAAVNPKPVLDRWQQEAVAAMAGVFSRYQASVPRALSAAGVLRRFDVGSFAGPATVSAGPQLWAASIRRVAGVELRLARFVGSTQPPAVSGQTLVITASADQGRAGEMARAVLAGVTPAVLEELRSGLARIATPVATPPG